MNGRDQIPDAFSPLEQSILTSNVETLWHYTTLEGLLGILRSKSIWATHVQSLNDHSELRYVLDKLQGKWGKGVALADQRALDVFVQQQLLQSAELYVASFCEEGDLLSQWRGYAGNSGVAVGFDAIELMRSMHASRSGMLLRVLYEEDDADEAAQYIRRRVLEVWREAFPEGILDFASKFTGEELSLTIQNKGFEKVVDAASKNFFQIAEEIASLGIISLRHKHPSFVEESEWRLIHQSPRSNDGLNYRISGNALIPYRSMPLGDAPDISPIRRIRLGPGVTDDTKLWTVRHLLASEGYERVQVDISEVPLRW